MAEIHLPRRARANSTGGVHGAVKKFLEREREVMGRRETDGKREEERGGEVGMVLVIAGEAPVAGEVAGSRDGAPARSRS